MAWAVSSKGSWEDCSQRSGEKTAGITPGPQVNSGQEPPFPPPPLGLEECGKGRVREIKMEEVLFRLRKEVRPLASSQAQ